MHDHFVAKLVYTKFRPKYVLATARAIITRFFFFFVNVLYFRTIMAGGAGPLESGGWIPWSCITLAGSNILINMRSSGNHERNLIHVLCVCSWCAVCVWGGLASQASDQREIWLYLPVHVIRPCSVSITRNDATENSPPQKVCN